MNNKICIISPYFGKLPSNIDLTIKTMCNNDFIDWVIITDDYENKSFDCKNVKIIKMTFVGLKELINKKLGTNISHPYKLCDYKITYGIIFSEILKNYDFWGYCDLDMIFGDLSNVFCYEKLKKYDKFFVKGHLSIYRNDKKLNDSIMNFKLINKDIYKILNSKYIFCIDERYPTSHTGVNDVLEKSGYNIYDVEDNFFDCSIKSKNFYNVDHSNYERQYLVLKDKKIFLKVWNMNFNKEIIYFHFQKKHLNIYCDSSNLLIVPHGFYNYRNVTKKDFYLFHFRIFWYIKFRIIRKITNCKRNREVNISINTSNK